MIKYQLIQKLAIKAGVTQEVAEKVYMSLCKLIVDEVIQGETVNLIGVGRFYREFLPSKRAMNPKTRERFIQPCNYNVKIKFSTRFKKMIRKIWEEE